MKTLLPFLPIILLSFDSSQLKTKFSTTFKCPSVDLFEVLAVVPKKETPNFMARYLYGNIKRGLINMHINIRSLYNKMGEASYTGNF